MSGVIRNKTAETLFYFFENIRREATGQEYVEKASGIVLDQIITQ